MTFGDGILWSTVLILLAASIYLISTRKKWITVGKVFGVLILIGAVLGGGGAGVYWYMNRPVLVTELDGIKIGMAPVEVSILKGVPINADQESASAKFNDERGEYRMIWAYRDGSNEATLQYAVFGGDSTETMIVNRACQRGGYQPLLGLSTYSSEKAVIDKLGEPTHVSIDADGLKKLISFSKYKVAYEIEAGKVKTVCVNDSGKQEYADEYGDEPGPE